MSYSDLLERRAMRATPIGQSINQNAMHPDLKPFQKKIVEWACNGGRNAIWADTGLGKTWMQVEWCRLVTTGRALIVAPLAVCDQTIREAAKHLGVTIKYVRDATEVTDDHRIFITNFEMVPKIDPSLFDAIALDEASILKQSDGKTRKMLIEHFQTVQYRSTWTATPGPNDPEELTNQSEFLGHMTRTNMLASYFVHDADGWRLKGHAIGPMIKWMCTWAMAVKKPSDLGDSDEGYDLPGLEIIPETVHTRFAPDEGELFVAQIGGVTGRAKTRRESLPDRVARTVELIQSQPDEQWLLWVGLNDEADALAKALPDAVNIHGSLTPEQKSDGLHAFAQGDTKILITKPAIASMGLNFQSCARTVFVGLSDSYEQYYQCIRRFYRFGQQRVVHAHIVLSDLEQQIAHNVMRKERQANRLIDLMIQHQKEQQK